MADLPPFASLSSRPYKQCRGPERCDVIAVAGEFLPALCSPWTPRAPVCAQSGVESISKACTVVFSGNAGERELLFAALSRSEGPLSHVNQA